MPHPTPLTEFGLIRRWFSHPLRDDVPLGVGDDCALLRVPNGHELAVTIDTLNEGVHFFPGADPEALGHKALAVSLSDLAAMGAEPAWATLSLTLPQAEEDWLERFAAGLFRLAERYRVQLVGGDTTRGPLAITVQAHGFVPVGTALRRSGAHPGDLVFVTGTLGDAGLAVAAGPESDALPAAWRGYLRQRRDWPEPRVAVGLALRGLASAAIDISDGLAADLGHLLSASGAGARIHCDRLPLSPALRAQRDEPTAIDLALAGGDDYELCFTVPPERRQRLATAAEGFDCPITQIGVIEPEPGLRCVPADGSLHPPPLGYRHF